MREKNEKYRYEIPKEKKRKKVFFHILFFVYLENENGKQSGILQDDFLFCFHLNQSILYIF